MPDDLAVRAGAASDRHATAVVDTLRVGAGVEIAQKARAARRGAGQR